MEHSFENETILSAELGNYAYYDFLPVNIIIELDNRDKVPGRIFTKTEPLLPGCAEYSTIKKCRNKKPYSDKKSYSSKIIPEQHGPNPPIHPSTQDILKTSRQKLQPVQLKT